MCGGGWIKDHKKELLGALAIGGAAFGLPALAGLLGAGAGAGASAAAGGMAAGEGAMIGEGLASVADLAATGGGGAGLLGNAGAIGAAQAGMEGAVLPPEWWEALGPTADKLGKVGKVAGMMNGQQQQPPPPISAVQPMPTGGGMQVQPAAPTLGQTYPQLGPGAIPGRPPMTEEERRRRRGGLLGGYYG